MSFDEKNAEINGALGNRLDQLNTAIDTIEKSLRDLGLFVECSFSYASWPDDPIMPSYYTYGQIGMTKLQGQWRLAHGYMHDQHPDEVEWKPLRDAAVHERIQGIKNISALRDEILASKARLIPKIESALKEAIAAIDDIGNSGPGSDDNKGTGPNGR